MSPPNGYGMVAMCKIADRAHCDSPIYRLGYCREHWERFVTPTGTQEERDRAAAHDREVLARQKQEWARRWGRR